MAVTSLNTIREDIKGFFTGHAQVNSYFYGSIEDYVSISDKEYYAVNTEFISASVSGKYINYQFSVTVADLMSLDYPDTEHQAVSNCILIGNDFLSWLTGSDYTYAGANFQPFKEETGDICAGVVLGFSIQVPLAGNECATPVKS